MTEVKPRNLGITRQASYANEEAREDGYTTRKTDKTRRRTWELERWKTLASSARDLMDTRDATQWLRMT